ncbi:MAG: hypothetical protein H7145_18640 [Akkermansiaceae bacterium]|nr:hypothetical protein [Armatimonadota bacterium]
MKATRKQNVKRLTAALYGGEIVDYQTHCEQEFHEYGFVFGLNDDFVLIQNVSKDVFLDGYSVLPVREIKSVIVGKETFLPRGLAHFDEKPSAPSGICLDDSPSLLASADVHFPLVSLEVGRKKPGCLFVGRVADLKNRYVMLRQITSEAKWEETPRKYRLRDITRVDFGGRYEAALWRVAQSELTNSDSA